jgi:hypothetical protein
MEDLLETIVGNIQDEYDKEENEYQKLSDTEYTIDGWISVDEVEDLLGIKIPDDTEYDTLGGVVVDMLGDLPEEGQHPSVQIDRVRFTVLEVDDPSEGRDPAGRKLPRTGRAPGLIPFYPIDSESLSPEASPQGIFLRRRQGGAGKFALFFRGQVCYDTVSTLHTV